MSDTFDEEMYFNYITKDPYLNFVAMEAQKLGRLFFIDSGEGNDYVDPKTGWLIEDLSCWLVNPNCKSRFLQLYQQKNGSNKSVYKVFSREYRFVEWTITDEAGLSISFVDYGTYFT